MSVMSCSVKGKLSEKKSPLRHFDTHGLAYDSYLRVCGSGDEYGDGFVPCCAGHIGGATQINLQNVRHAYDPSGRECWYGSPDVIGLWHEKMMEQIVHTKVVVD